MKSTAQASLKVIAGRWKYGHENLLASFVSSILENKEVPYPLKKLMRQLKPS